MDIGANFIISGPVYIQKSLVPVLNISENDNSILYFILQNDARITIQVFGIDGSLIRTLFRGQLAAGRHEYSWNGRNGSGNAVSAGLYFLRIQGAGFDETRKIVVVK
jgi:flagellar hook assembly protein FlgD